MAYYYTFGKTGSGKSFFMIRTIRKWAKSAYKSKEKLFIYSNVYLDLSFIYKKKHIQVNVVQFRTWEELFNAIVPNSLIIMDECSMYFNSRTWEKTPTNFLDLLSQGRKGGIDIFAISQRYKSIDVEFRDKAHSVFHTKSYLGGLFFASFEVQRDDDNDGDKITGREMVDWWTLFSKDKSRYNTFEVVNPRSDTTVVQDMFNRVLPSTTFSIKEEFLNEPQRGIQAIKVN